MLINLDYQKNVKLLNTNDLLGRKYRVLKAKDTMLNRTGAGKEFLGWLNWPYDYDKEEVARIKKASEKIRKDSEVLVVIGIGGSYLGAKAVIHALSPYFSKDKGLEVIFAGNTLSSAYLDELLEYLKNKSFSINVISKSGTTTEPAIAFRLLKSLLENKYGQEAKKRIFATTDAKKGALHDMSVAEGYEMFVVPDDIGGRYSVFTAVGLLPIAAAGLDIEQLLKGAQNAKDECYREPFETNSALQYAAVRNLMYESGKKIEALVSYEPRLSFVSEWWKQLFGESEGKNHKGLFPASLTYSTDLHSLGQYIQDGERTMFETVLNIAKPASDVVMNKEKEDLDQLNYLEGMKLSEVNKKAMLGTCIAHIDGGVPNFLLNIPEINAFNLGYLMYYFMFSCGVSCYMLNINPFNQEGVESYKKNMFALLGKKGFEELKKSLEKIIG
jgi:glucose-6-phosphate isomerase